MALGGGAATVRHDRDREHLRRHPVGRGGHHRGIDGDASVREPGPDARRAPGRALRAHPRDGARHRGAGESPIRSRRSSRPRCCCATRWSARTTPIAWSGPSSARWTPATERRTFTLPGTTLVGTAEMGDRVHPGAGAALPLKAEGAMTRPLPVSGARSEDTMAGHRVAVVGATGAAGEMTLRILEERKFPVRELRAFASERSVGKTVAFAGESIRVEKVSAGRVPRSRDRVLLGGHRPVEGARAAGGAGRRRGRGQVQRLPDGPGGPARSCPRSTPHAIRGHRGIVASPNCTTVVTVMAAGAPPPRGPRPSGRGDELPGRLGRRRQGRRGPAPADPGLGARRGDRADVLSRIRSPST